MSTDAGIIVAGVLTFNHLPGGANVLYMDGHVEFLKYPSNFHIVETSAMVKEISHHGVGKNNNLPWEIKYD